MFGQPIELPERERMVSLLRRFYDDHHSIYDGHPEKDPIKLARKSWTHPGFLDPVGLFFGTPYARINQHYVGFFEVDLWSHIHVGSSADGDTPFEERLSAEGAVNYLVERNKGILSLHKIIGKASVKLERKRDR